MLPSDRMRACPQCLTVFEGNPDFCRFDGVRLEAFDRKDPLEGRCFRGYRFDSLIGPGAAGVVYRGSVEASERPCAIKLIYGEMATDAQAVEQLGREVRAIRRINHPNIVEILDSGRTECHVPFLVMELLEGRSLRKVVETEIPLGADRVGQLAQQLASGLSAAHRLGYVHRDLKPANIMLTPTEYGWERAKILDFGIIASLRAPAEHERLSKPGYILGAPTYMAPEQVDPAAVAPQTDVYALGVILYELLTGEPPFTGTLERVLVAKMTEPPPPLPPWTGGLGDLVGRLLATKPEDRPPSALHVHAELKRLGLVLEDPAPTIRILRKVLGTPDGPEPGRAGFTGTTGRPNGKADRPPLTPRPVATETYPPSPDPRLSYANAEPARAARHRTEPGLLEPEPPASARPVDVDASLLFAAGATSTRTVGPPDGGGRRPTTPTAEGTIRVLRDMPSRMPNWMLVLLLVALAAAVATLTYAHFGAEATVVLADPPADNVVSP